MNIFQKQYFLEGQSKVELDVSNYATKADFKNSTNLGTSKFAEKVDLASLKSDLHKYDIDKLKNVANWFKKFEK